MATATITISKAFLLRIPFNNNLIDETTFANKKSVYSGILSLSGMAKLTFSTNEKPGLMAEFESEGKIVHLCTEAS